MLLSDDWRMEALTGRAVLQPRMPGCSCMSSHRALVLQDKDAGAELAIITDRAQGGGSLASGQAEIMVHRRTLLDDQRGVGEPINETMCGCSACACAGLIARGTHYLTLQVAPRPPHAYEFPLPLRRGFLPFLHVRFRPSGSLDISICASPLCLHCLCQCGRVQHVHKLPQSINDPHAMVCRGPSQQLNTGGPCSSG